MIMKCVVKHICRKHIFQSKMESSISKIFGEIPDVDGQGLGSRKKLQRSSALMMHLAWAGTPWLT